MTPIRFALWAAVSTDAQAADDKFSLDEQQARCKSAGLAHGWVETAGPYIAAGESRTRYINLSDAERAIPALRKLLDDAQAHTYDVLICYDFDRFRELLDSIARTLSHYGCQLFSVSQPLEPQSPDDYNPYASDTEFMLRGMNQLINRASIANLRRKYQTQMPRRILERKLPHTIPYGYKKPAGHETDRNAIPIQDESAAPIVIQIKNEFLAGKSMNQIAADLTTQAVPPPGNGKRKTPKTRWHAATVIDILENSFYAGYVTWGKSKSELDPRTGTTHRIFANDPRRLITARGLHDPLWDDETRATLEAELKRRKRSYRVMTDNALSGILRCSICGAMLWHNIYGRKETRGTAWRCSIFGAKHMIVADRAIIKNLAPYVLTDLNRAPEAPGSAITALIAEIAELKTARTRIDDAYLSGLFDLEKSTRLASPIDAKLAELETRLRNDQMSNTKAQSRALTLAKLRQHQNTLPALFDLASPNDLHTILTSLYQSITVTPTGEIVKAETQNS